MKNLLTTLSTASLILVASFSQAQAQEPASVKAPRCAVAKSTMVETTADGRTVIKVKTVQVCK